MTRTPELLIGISGAGVVTPSSPNPDIFQRFKLVKESGEFDYYDRTPPPAEIDQWKAASKRSSLPMRAGGFYYRLGRDEDLLLWHLRLAADLGAWVHNVQIFDTDAAGKAVSNAQVAEIYLRALEVGERVTVLPCFEVHINMWSEHFGRVEEVARIVECHGVKFNMTFDVSHVIFKMENPDELRVQDLDVDVNAGRMILDPRVPGNVCDRWFDRGWIRHVHARPAVPNNPKNIWARHPNGEFGRGVQYPFCRPDEGQWHSAWEESRLEPWKHAMRNLLRRHCAGEFGNTLTVSTEIIPATDYGEGAKYSLFDDNVAVARWLRSEWHQLLAAR